MSDNFKQEGSETFGYPSKLPCAVCLKHKSNQSEPRFGYTVCIDHQHISPVEISRIRIDGGP